MHNKIYSKIHNYSHLEDLELIAKDLANEIMLPSIILLEGNLGSGKTTFLQFFVQALGITDLVTSPTFNKIHIYQNPQHASLLKVFHLDLYREMPQVEEFEELLLEDGALICIEWADYLQKDKNLAKIPTLKDRQIFRLQFVADHDLERQLTVSKLN